MRHKPQADIMQENKVKTLPRREEISNEHKWKLEDIYAFDSLWEKDFEQVRKLAGDIVKFRGRLGESAANLLEALKLSDGLMSLNDKVFVYARMRRDEDNTNTVYQALADRAKSLGVEVYGACSFITPEIISIPDEKLKEFIDTEKGLELYSFFINENIRQKQHILSDKEEELLAFAGEMAMSSRDIFTMFNNADIRFSNIKDENSDEVELTKGRYIQFLESQERRVREDAFHSMYQSYISNKNTLAAMMNANVRKDIFFSRVRKYRSALEASLDSDNVPVSVYDSLIDTINDNLGLLHKYIKLRKKVLGLPELHLYDMYVPLVKEIKMDTPYGKSLEMVQDALAPLGDEYMKDLKRGLASGWIDVYENRGKTGGAYSWGAYLTHPYVLLNYQANIKDVFTLAHEMGHAMHTFYSGKSQPYIYSEYKIFVAEVASTLNESLLMHYLLERVKDRNERAYLVNHYLEEFRGTVFRQVMFAEFEKMMHEKAESGQAITPELLCSMYRGLNEKYFGPEVAVDSEIDMEWSRIPHFYNSFYVYKYATGFSAAISLSQQILREGRPAVESYINFLCGGGSDYPIELLKKAGVDLTTGKPVVDAMKVFEEILGQMEELL